MYGEAVLEECYDRVIHYFDSNSVFDFASNIYILENNETSYIGSLEKLVYTLGDMSEIYTRRERDFISKVSNVIMYSPFVLQGRKSSISCSLIAVDLSNLSDPIYNSIAFMKICNKALSGFNLYFIVSDDAIYIGHDDLTSGSSIGCSISYPITSKIDWEQLQDNFLYVDNQSFYAFYSSFSDSISTVYECYESSVQINDSIYYFDEENSEYICLSNRFYNSNDDTQNEKNSKECFENEVADSQVCLSYITTNKVNTFELLIDAEEAESQLSKQDLATNNDALNDDENKLSKYKDMLDDPEALIKMLKKQRA